MEPSLNQRSYLVDFLSKYDDTDPEILYSLAKKVSMIEYKYLLSLCFDAQRHNDATLLKSEVAKKLLTAGI